jgi:hypothetical protein
MLLETTGKDFRAEEYGKVIENIQKSAISSQLKNTDLSGTPTAGTVEAKRFVNAQSQTYGTARAAGKAQSVPLRPVTVPVDQDREIIEEIEQKDTLLYGVEGTIQRRVANHQTSMTRELELAFFVAANAAGTAITTSVTDIDKLAEAVIQQIEATKNDFVNGVNRDMIALVCDTSTYGDLRGFLDKGANNANVTTAPAEFGMFHGVSTYSSVYLPAKTGMIAMVRGSVAQPVLPLIAPPRELELSKAYAFGIFFSFGTKAVMPDLIVKYLTE